MVPAAKLLHRHVEAISHRHQRVAMFHLVEVRRDLLEGAGGTGMIERVGRGEIVARLQLVDKDDLRRGLRGNRERWSRSDSPATTL